MPRILPIFGLSYSSSSNPTTCSQDGGIFGKAAITKAGVEIGMDGFKILFDEWADFQAGSFEQEHGPILPGGGG